MKRVFREYWVEFVALLVVLLGVFLLLEQFSIREALLLAYQKTIAILGNWLDKGLESFQNYIFGFTASDLVGWVMVLIALSFIVWRGRYHFIRCGYWKAVNCPRCGSGLHRIRRSAWDRFLSHTLLFKARRYQCENPECAWSGLRQQRDEDRRRRKGEE